MSFDKKSMQRPTATLPAMTKNEGESVIMVLNDFKADFKKALKVENKMSKDVAEKSGLPAQYISQIFGRVQPMNDTIVKMYDVLGYDIQITYIQRDDPNYSNNILSCPLKYCIPDIQNKLLSADDFYTRYRSLPKREMEIANFILGVKNVE